MSYRSHLSIIVLFIILAGLLGCTVRPGVSTPTESGPTAVPVTPTPTEPPLAARVNGDGIWLSEYQAQLQQFQSAATELGKDYSGEEARNLVLDNIISEVLLAQAAIAAGHPVNDADVQAHIADLTAQIGGESNLQTWMSENGYDQAGFFQKEKRSMAAVWQRDQIVASVPEVAEQVHARQILVVDEALANQILGQIQAGASFDTLAFQYDPLTGGDLGWFPRGYLTQPAVEEAAFALQAGEISPLIHTDFGYHILKVIERDDAHPLAADARQALQRLALSDWIDQQKAKSTIEIYLP